MDKPLAIKNDAAMLSLILAGQLAAAQLVSELPFRPRDLPIGEFAAGSKVRLVAYRATIRPDGTIQDCKVEISSGSVSLDKITCRSVTRRARFKPATMADGGRAYGVYRSTAAWVVDPPASYIYPMDMQLKVARLPTGERSPATVDVAMSVDPEGKASSCIADDTSRKKNNPVLVQAACRELVSKYRALPALTDAEAPVASVQNVRVSFVQD